MDQIYSVSTDVIGKVKDFIRHQLIAAESGHDLNHAMRVWQNAKLIAAEETVDLYVVELAALLHDIADAKFHDGDEELGPNMAADFLRELSISPKVIHHVCQIIRHMSFKGGNEANPFNSREMEVVQDADRLDALGAIGVARAFSYGGYRGRTFFNPAIKPNLNMDKETYRQSAAPTINHFFEKLLVLKDRMHTKKGREVAEDRHGFLLQFLEQFFREMDCDPKWPDE